MRQIVLDTETTGLKTSDGHRIIEIGAVELINRRLTDNYIQYYINPERDIDEGAQAVHGITLKFLADKPLFKDIASNFLKFISGSELIIHNATFDLGFLNYEFQLLNPDHNLFENQCSVIDTLELARKLHPGQKNNLDALCKRYNVDNTHRLQHGAHIDAMLLARVYLAMTSGQISLFEEEKTLQSNKKSQKIKNLDSSRKPLPIIHATENELHAHQSLVELIKKNSGVEVEI